MTKLLWFTALGILFCQAACAQIAARQKEESVRSMYRPKVAYERPTSSGHRNSSSLNLDDKAKTKVNEAFQAVVLNDDKKAKLSYGRSHRFMPEFVQFAFDLRFKNYEHALELLPKTPYTDEEKALWKKVLEMKPKNIQKALCEELTSRQFAFDQAEPLKEEVAWYADIQDVTDDLFQNQKQIVTKQDVQDVLTKLSLKDDKGNLRALSDEDQKAILNDAFFDLFRNAQRRDTNAWMAYYVTPVKAWNYQRGFNPNLAYDLFASLAITETPKKKHFLHRLKGIIKDMRVETLTLRTLGSKAVGDEDDLKKVDGLLNFKSRYPVTSSFLHLETTLATCGLVNKKE